MSRRKTLGTYLVDTVVDNIWYYVKHPMYVTYDNCQYGNLYLDYAVQYGGKENYYEMKFIYNYGIFQKPRIGDCVIEGAEMESKSGIVLGDGGFCINAVSTERRFVDLLSHIYTLAKAGLRDRKYFESRPPPKSQLIQSNSLELEVCHYAKFTDPKGRIIPPSILFGAHIKFIPLITFDAIELKNGIAKLKTYIGDTIVTYIVPPLSPIIKSQPYISYMQYDPSKMGFHPITYGKKGYENSYVIPIQYKYGSSYSDFKMLGCKMRTVEGVIVVNGSSLDYYNKFNPKKKLFFLPSCIDTHYYENEHFISVIESIGEYCSMYLPSVITGTQYDNNRVTVYNSMEADIFPTRGNRQGHIQLKISKNTVFTDKQGRVIPWLSLVGLMFSFQPILHIKRLTVNSIRTILKIKIVSAVVGKLDPRDVKQKPTIERMNRQNPEMVERAVKQLDELMNTQRQGISNKVGKIKDKKMIGDDSSLFPFY